MLLIAREPFETIETAREINFIGVVAFKDYIV